jgi:hypothetical protein
MRNDPAIFRTHARVRKQLVETAVTAAEQRLRGLRRQLRTIRKQLRCGSLDSAESNLRQVRAASDQILADLETTQAHYCPVIP